MTASKSTTTAPDTDLPLLDTGPTLVRRKERVPVPELRGSVLVVGLLASEAWAVTAIKEQALARLYSEAQAAHAQGGEPAEPPAGVPLDLGFDEWRQYGRYVPELLARSVQGTGGLSLYSADEWELMDQHHPGVIGRLQIVAERLSGLDGRARAKNSSSQS